MADPVAGTTHHIVLEDGSTRLGLLSADNMRSFLRVPMARTSLKTASGDTLYSDLEPPYAAEMQNDFSGGRGQKWLRDDKTRFYDSRACDTRIKGQCTLGPAISTATLANVGMPEHQPGNVTDAAVHYVKIQQTNYSSLVTGYIRGDPIWPVYRLAQSFTTPNFAGCQIASVQLKLSLTAESAVTVTAAIYANSGNAPTGSALASNAQSVPVGSKSTVTFTFTPTSLAAYTKYWIVLSSGAEDRVYVAGVTGGYAGGQAAMWDEESGWVPNYDDMYFVISFTSHKRAQSFVFSGSGSYNVTHCRLLLKKSGTVSPTVRIETDSGGSPSGTPVAEAVVDNADIGTSYSWVFVDFTTFALTKGTTYWIVLSQETQLTQGNFTQWGYDAAEGYTGGAAKYKTGAGSWSAFTGDFYFRINSGQGLSNDVFRLFEYKGQVYAVDAPPEGADPSKLWMNGDRGAADSNSADKTKLIDATKSWTNDEWIGCVAKITAGPGINEYRTIIDNDGTSLTVDEAWTTTHTTSTEYVILGSTKWTDVTPAAGDTIDGPVKDVCVANGILYLAFGEDFYLWRYREYNNAGTWTKQSADDGTGHADLLLEHKGYIYRARLSNQLSKAPVVTWGTNLTFDTAINVGTSDYAITALQVYDGEVWIGKENTIWTLKGTEVERVPVDFTSMSNVNNCRRMLPWNVYLFFPLGYGLERLFGQQIDDMGPNRDEGLPDGRQGVVADLIAMPSQLLAALDAGPMGTSAILSFNERGWHEIIRGTAAYERITTMLMQSIPGQPSRLWYGQGNDICHVKVPAYTINPLKATGMQYRSSGELTTSWIDIHLAAVDKYFKELKVVADYLESGVTITAYYQTDDSDDDDEWTEIGTFDTSPYEELAVGTNITGRRIRFRFVLNTNDTSKTPNFIAYVLEMVARIAPKSRWEPVVRMADRAMQLNGVEDEVTRNDRLAQLDEWAGSATPLTMTTCDPAWTDISVMIEPAIELDKRYEQSETGEGRIVAETAKIVIWET